MFPDSGWLKILDQKSGVFAGLSIGLLIIYVCAEIGVFHLGLIPNGWRAFLVAGAIIFGALALTSIIQWITVLIQTLIRRKNVLSHLDSLSKPETELLAYCLIQNQKSCTAVLERTVTLKDKGLIRYITGTHDLLKWPFTIPDFVWRELQKRRDEFDTEEWRKKMRLPSK